MDLTSKDVDQIYKALALFQEEMDPVIKARPNTFFGSTYADLSDIMAAIRPVMKTHNLGYLQPSELRTCSYQIRQEEQDPETKKWYTVQVKNVEMTGNVVLTRVFHHPSGQWVQSETFFPPDSRGRASIPQSVAISHTYARRYALCALLGIPLDDSDGASEHKRQQQTTKPENGEPTTRAPKRPPGKKPTKAEVNRTKKQLEKAAEQGPGAYGKLWKDVDFKVKQEIIKADVEDGWFSKLKQDMQGASQV